MTLDRVYSNTRTLWIEPETGVIIRGQEDQLVVAEYEGEEVATLTDVVIGYNPATIADNADTYGCARDTAEGGAALGRPSARGILGLLLILLGVCDDASAPVARSREHAKA